MVPSDPPSHHGAMLHVQETMESMVGARHFLCMDLKSGFWQVKMADNILPSRWEAWECMNSYTCPTGCATPWQHSNASCKIVWGS